MEITWKVISGYRKGENEGKGTGDKKHNRHNIDRGRLRIA